MAIRAGRRGRGRSRDISCLQSHGEHTHSQDSLSITQEAAFPHTPGSSHHHRAGSLPVTHQDPLTNTKRAAYSHTHQDLPSLLITEALSSIWLIRLPSSASPRRLSPLTHQDPRPLAITEAAFSLCYTEIRLTSLSPRRLPPLTHQGPASLFADTHQPDTEGLSL